MNYELNSARALTMLQYLPEYYSTSRIMRSILDQQGTELDLLHRALNEILDQYFVGTASWEESWYR